MAARHAVHSGSVSGVEAGWRGRASLLSTAARPTAASPGTDLGVHVTPTCSAGDGSLNVSGEEWLDDMQSTLARSEASWQAGVTVWTPPLPPVTIYG